MKHFTTIVLLFLAFSFLVYAQDRASMAAPTIKPSGVQVVFTTEFADFVPGADYRLGVGTAGSKIAGAKLELLKNKVVLKKNPTSFEQGYTSSWWDVDSVSVRGFLLLSKERLGKVRLRVTLPRPEIDKLKKLYILVARKYGENRWYVEDGIELSDSHW